MDARRPGQLSGGQRQRVALARALVNQPKVLLLDEPLGALDLKLREQMQVELKSLQRALGITFVFVTHDQGEALSMADRVAVFNDGKIVQVGSPAGDLQPPDHALRRRLRRLLQRASPPDLVGLARRRKRLGEPAPRSRSHPAGNGVEAQRRDAASSARQPASTVAMPRPRACVVLLGRLQRAAMSQRASASAGEPGDVPCMDDARMTRSPAPGDRAA